MTTDRPDPMNEMEVPMTEIPEVNDLGLISIVEIIFSRDEDEEVTEGYIYHIDSDGDVCRIFTLPDQKEVEMADDFDRWKSLTAHYYKWGHLSRFSN